MWEGGTHLVGFVHAAGHLPSAPKNFTGLMHQADWVPTLLGAAGVAKLNDSAKPPMDGVDMWPALSDPTAITGPRTSVLLNVDPTNQMQLNDPHGWSGFAGIRVGKYKLVLGDPGVPNSWCWPNQNSTDDEVDALARALQEEAFDAQTHPIHPNGGPQVDEPTSGVCWSDAIASAPTGNCTVKAETCYPGNDLLHFESPGVQACCDACSAHDKCTSWTHNIADTPPTCWLKTRPAAKPLPSSDCTSGIVDSRPPAPPPHPGACAATEYPACTCAYNGTVPNNRMQPLLFDLEADPRETSNLATHPEHATTLASLRAALQRYIDSAVTPLNEPGPVVGPPWT